MRFASHRDIARAVERGVRKAGLPVAYSAGFSPHPKISYAGGAPTGTASEAEYLEIALTGQCTAPDVRDRLNASLPDGIGVIEVLELAGGLGGEGGLRLEGSHWLVVLPGVAPAEAARAVAAFLAAESVLVERSTSKGTRRLDARAAVLTLEPGGGAPEDGYAGCAILRMVVRHLTPAVRPDDILTALNTVAGLAPSSPPLVTRLAQGPLDVEKTSEGAGDGAAAGTARPAPPRPAQARPAPSCGSAAVRPAAASPARPRAARRVPEQPAQAAAQRQESETRVSDAAAAAVGNAAAPATPSSAYEQLPRGAKGPDSGPRAREYDGRLPGCSKPSGTTENQTTMGRQALATPLV